MKYIYWARSRTGRLLIILLAVITYFFLLTLNAAYYFPHAVSNGTPPWLSWMRFGFSEFVALMFLAVGALVWLYARNRRVAMLLFSFSFAVMVAFTVQTSAKFDNQLFSTIGFVAGALALGLLAILLLFFPRDYLSSPLLPKPSGVSEEKWRRGRQYYSALLLRGYLTLFILLGIIVSLHNALYYFVPALNVLNSIDYIFYIIAMVSILVTIIVSYRRSSSLRERQQQRIFVGGVILSVVPLLLLTVLPFILGLPSGYVVDSQLSTLTLSLLPLALGYTILRYQVLVFDAYIRRAVAWIIGGVGLAILGYLAVVLSSVLLSENVSVYVVSVVAIAILLAPCVWWLAHVVNERLFFSEISHYRRLVDSADIMAGEAFDLNEASRLTTLAAVNAFETQEVCLFVLDEDTGFYRLFPALKEDDPNNAPRRALLQRLLGAMKPSTQEIIDSVKADETIINQVASAERPLLLSEASRPGELPRGLARYFVTTSPLDSAEPLLTAVRAQGKMIGLLVLGERGDHQQYAGPDFEAIHLILARFSPVIETARVMLKLRAAYERQKELDRLKDQFIMTASHELRTPLTAVQGYIDLLATYNLTLDSEVRADFIAKANRGCDELTLMVGNIMDASRVEIDVKNIKLGPVRLADSVQHVLEILEAMTRRENRIIQVHIPAEILVMADSMRLRQVLLNLVSNALKYSTVGSGIEITLDCDDELITIRVCDQGLGVPPKEQERLFQRFVRLERDMNSLVRGAGLGLYISKQLVEAMGGRIWVESTGIPGKGSVFAFTLRRSSEREERLGFTPEPQERSIKLSEIFME